MENDVGFLSLIVAPNTYQGSVVNLANEMRFLSFYPVAQLGFDYHSEKL
jgi:hypothetical protein